MHPSSIENGWLYVPTFGPFCVLRGVLDFAAGCLLSNVLDAKRMEGNAISSSFNAPFHLLGKVSYSIYPLQLPIMSLLAHLARHVPEVMTSRMVVILTIGVVCALAALTFRFIERPGRSRAQDRQPAMGVAAVPR